MSSTWNDEFDRHDRLERQVREGAIARAIGNEQDALLLLKRILKRYPQIMALVQEKPREFRMMDGRGGGEG